VAQGLDRDKPFSGRKRNMDSQQADRIIDPTGSAQDEAAPAVPGEAGAGAPIGIARGGPPSQVLEEIERAGRIHAEIRAEGNDIRFHGGLDGAVLIELCSIDGELIRALSSVEVVELAAGRVTA
jgi:hypothetical protein